MIFFKISIFITFCQICLADSMNCVLYDSNSTVEKVPGECVKFGACTCQLHEHLQWKFNNTTVFLNKMPITNGSWIYSENFSVWIQSMKLSNVGTYACFCGRILYKQYVLEIANEVESHFYVKVNDANYTSNTNLTLTINELECMTVACHADGERTRVHLTWLVNNNTIDSSNIFQTSKRLDTWDFVTEIKNYTFIGNESITCVRGSQFNIKEHAIRISLLTFDASSSSTPERSVTTEVIDTNSNIMWLISTVFPAAFLIVSVLAVLLITHKGSKQEKNEPGRVYEECGTIDNMLSEVPSIPNDGKCDGVVAMQTEVFLKRDCVSLLSRLPGTGKMKYWTAVMSSDVSQKFTFVAKTLSDSAHLKDLYNFQKIAKQLQGLKLHKNIVQILGIDDTDVPCFVYHHFEEGGTLRDFMLKSFDRRRESQLQSMVPEMTLRPLEKQKLQLIKFALDVAEGMTFLRKNNVCHPGICSRKVLLSRNGTCKLYDFVPEDIAQHRMKGFFEKKCPPLGWLPPESIFLRLYSWQADVWSFAVVLWEIFSLGQTPYEGLSTEEIETEIRCDRCLGQPLCCPGGVYSIMLSSWNVSYEDRPTFLVITKNLRAVMENFKQDYDCENRGTEDPNYFVLEEPMLENEYEF